MRNHVGRHILWATCNKTDLQPLRYVFCVMFLWHSSKLVLTLVDSVELMTAERSLCSDNVQNERVVDNNLNVHIMYHYKKMNYKLAKRPSVKRLAQTYQYIALYALFQHLESCIVPFGSTTAQTISSFTMQRTLLPTLSQLLNSLSGLGNDPISLPSL